MGATTSSNATIPVADPGEGPAPLPPYFYPAESIETAWSCLSCLGNDSKNVIIYTPGLLTARLFF